MRTTYAPSADTRARACAVLDHVPGWQRVDDVALAGTDVDHVIATPLGLLVVVAGRGDCDLARAAAAGRRVRRVVSLPPNAIDVAVHAALLVWGAAGSGTRTGWDDAQGVYVLDGERPWNWPSELTAAIPADAAGRAGEAGEALRKVRGWAAYQQPRRGSRGAVGSLTGGRRRGLLLQRRIAVRA